MTKDFIGLNQIDWKYLLKYFTTTKSLLRIYQDQFTYQVGKDTTGSVIEIGGEIEYSHKAFFPNACSFKVTNVDRSYEEFLDVTSISYKDNTQDCYLCLSVLEHVYDFQLAIREMHRSLKKGGKLIIVVPFAFPLHDKVDYWRFTPDSFMKLLEGFEVVNFTKLGGKYSVFATELQRPKGVIRLKNLPVKFIGLMMLFLGKFLEKPDNFSSGFGLCAIKK